MPHLIHVIVAVFCLIIFITLASLVTMGEMELNPISKNWLASAHSK